MLLEVAYLIMVAGCVAALAYLFVGHWGRKRLTETSDFEVADRLVNLAIGRFLKSPCWSHAEVAGRLTFENHGNREFFLMDGQIVAVIQSFTADTPTGDLFKVTTFY